MIKQSKKGIKNFRIFEIKYFGATNTKGSRIKIIDKRFNKSKFVYRSYEHINGRYDGIDYLNSIGIKLIGGGEMDKDRDILITDNFEIQINEKVRK